LKFEQGSIRVSLPTVIAPRYGDAIKGNVDSHQSVETNFLMEYPLSLSLYLTGGIEKATVECPSHQVQVSKQDNGLLVGIERQAFLDRDFILNLTNLENKSSCIVTPDLNLGPEGCTVLASFCPPPAKKNTENSINLKILVDCSGSMQGDSIISAKRALHHILSYLEPEDKFSYTKFGNYPDHLFVKLKKADRYYISAASLLIDNTEADMGGTEITEALESTFKLAGAEGKADILLITDGEVWNTAEILDSARKSGHRIFAVGVGSAPAETLLKELAEQTGGACELVSPKENIELAILRMFHRIRQAKAHNIEIDWGTEEQPEWTIGTDTAIFSENTTHVFAGFKSKPKKPALLSYQLGDDSERIGVGAAELTTINCANLPRLANAQRIKTALEGDQIALALMYQLITKHTNCLLVHIRADDEKATDLPELMNIAQMQAAGWSGAGSVTDAIDIPKIDWSAPSASIRMPTTASLLNASYDSYDLPRVLRSSQKISESIHFKESLNRSEDNYDIPAFLRKQAEKVSAPTPKPKLLDPKDVILLANEILTDKKMIAELVSILDESKFEQEVLEILMHDLQFLNKEELWSAILAWILLRLEEYGDWNDQTISAIESLTNDIDSSKLNKAFQVFNIKMADLGMHGWLTLDFN
jgi:Ca-activated chloride channel family protein